MLTFLMTPIFDLNEFINVKISVAFMLFQSKLIIASLVLVSMPTLIQNYLRKLPLIRSSLCCCSWTSIHITFKSKILFKWTQQFKRRTYKVIIYFWKYFFYLFIFLFDYRYQFFLQLKHDIQTGRLECPFDTAVQLAACSLQCEHNFIWNESSFK